MNSLGLQAPLHEIHKDTELHCQIEHETVLEAVTTSLILIYGISKRIQTSRLVAYFSEEFRLETEILQDIKSDSGSQSHPGSMPNMYAQAMFKFSRNHYHRDIR